MIINLFIGVITTSMNEAKEELGNVEKEINAEATEEDLKDMKLQDYMHSRLIQIQEIVHTIFEEFQELAVQEKERVSGAGSRWQRARIFHFFSCFSFFNDKYIYGTGPSSGSFQKVTTGGVSLLH